MVELQRGSSIILSMGGRRVEKIAVTIGWIYDDYREGRCGVFPGVFPLDRKHKHVQSEGYDAVEPGVADVDDAYTVFIELGALDDLVRQLVFPLGITKDETYDSPGSFKDLAALRVYVRDERSGELIASCDISGELLCVQSTMILCRVFLQEGAWWQFIVGAEPRDEESCDELIRSFGV